jgi:hypothetical protein
MTVIRRIGAGGEQALDLAQVATGDGGVKQGVAERALRVGIADRSGHARDTPVSA